MRCEKCNDVILMLYGKAFCANPNCDFVPNSDGVFAEELIEDISIEIMLDRIEGQGKQSYYDECSPGNPYDKGTGEFKAWQRGWESECDKTKEFSNYKEIQDTLNIINNKRQRLIDCLELLNNQSFFFGYGYRKLLKKIKEKKEGLLD